MRHTFFALLSGFFLNMAFIFPTPLQAEEFGKAGYYANSLHGRKTASGEKYDKNELTCAHKTLPFGTKVRVTRLDNKRSVIVRVNDRGPYSAGYVVDLSRKAAEELDIIKAGHARVKVEVLEDESLVPVQHSTPAKLKSTEGQMTMLQPKKSTKTTTAKGGKALRPATYSTDDPEPASSAAKKAIKSDLYKVDIKANEKKGFGVQVSTLYDANNVLPIVTKLQKQWPGKVLVDLTQDDANNQTTYKVIIGSYSTKSAAEETQRTAARQGYKRCFVVALNEM